MLMIYIYTMRILLLSLLLFGISVTAECQTKGFGNFQSSKLIMRYDSIRHGVQTSGGDSTMIYKIYRSTDGLMMESGKLYNTFIPLSGEKFPKGVYLIYFRAKYRYINNQFTIE